MIGTYWKLLSKNRNIRNLWFAHSISFAGDWFNRIAILDYIHVHEANKFYLGVILVCSFLPPFLLAPIVGVVIDRFNRKIILLISDITRFFLVLLFLLVTPETFWLIFVVEFLVFSVSAFFLPTKAAILPDLAKGQDLTTANALGQTSFGLMLTMGSLLGGVVTATIGFNGAIVINAVTFLISALYIWPIDIPHYNLNQVTSDMTFGLKKIMSGFLLTIRESVIYTLNNRYVLALILVKPGWTIGGGAIITLLPVFGKDVFLAGSIGIGVLYMSRGIGIMVGSFLGQGLLSYSKFNMMWMIAIIFLIYSLFLFIFSFTTNLLFGSLLLVLATSFSSNLWLFSRITLQKMIPDYIRGRIFATDDGLSTFFFNDFYFDGRMGNGIFFTANHFNDSCYYHCFQWISSDTFSVSGYYPC